MADTIALLPNEGDPRAVFWCEGCGSHHFVRVPPHPHAWQWNGSMDKPTFTPSVLVTWTFGESREPHRCHSFVRDGRMEYLSDCTHALAGKTMDLPPIANTWGSKEGGSRE